MLGTDIPHINRNHANNHAGNPDVLRKQVILGRHVLSTAPSVQSTLRHSFVGWTSFMQRSIYFSFSYFVSLVDLSQVTQRM